MEKYCLWFKSSLGWELLASDCLPAGYSHCHNILEDETYSKFIDNDNITAIAVPCKAVAGTSIWQCDKARSRKVDTCSGYCVTYCDCEEGQLFGQWKIVSDCGGNCGCYIGGSGTCDCLKNKYQLGYCEPQDSPNPCLGDCWYTCAYDEDSHKYLWHKVAENCYNGECAEILSSECTPTQVLRTRCTPTGTTIPSSVTEEPVTAHDWVLTSLNCAPGYIPIRPFVPCNFQQEGIQTETNCIPNPANVNDDTLLCLYHCNEENGAYTWNLLNEDALEAAGKQCTHPNLLNLPCDYTTKNYVVAEVAQYTLAPIEGCFYLCIEEDAAYFWRLLHSYCGTGYCSEPLSDCLAHNKDQLIRVDCKKNIDLKYNSSFEVYENGKWTCAQGLTHESLGFNIPHEVSTYYASYSAYFDTIKAEEVLVPCINPNTYCKQSVCSWYCSDGLWIKVEDCTYSEIPTDCECPQPSFACGAGLNYTYTQQCRDQV